MADTATGAVTVKSTVVLDYETKKLYTVIITGTDNDGAVSATCTIGITDVQPWFSGGSTSIIVSDTVTSGDLTTLTCTDGGGTPTLTMTGDDSGADAKFSFASGTLTKSSVKFDAATKASYLLTVTCAEGAHTVSTTVTICVNNESNCPSSKASINSGILAGIIIPALLAIYRLS